MKLHQKSILIKLTEPLSIELFNQLQASNLSEAATLQKLLQLGLDVESGRYHDKELTTVNNRLDSLIRNSEANNKQLQLLNDGQGDIHDAITGQLSDADMLVTKTTQTHKERTSN